MTEKPLYNSKIVLTFVNLLKEKYRHVDPHEVLNYSGIKPYEVTDGGHWFTQTQVDLFIERLVQLTGNAGIAREGGRYAASGQSLGFIGKYLLGLIGPAHAFFSLNKSTANFTRSSSYQSRRIAANQVEITVTPAPGIEERPYQCENRTGFFEAMLMIFNYDMPVIEHPECMFRGGASCRYIVSWKKNLPTRLREARNCLALALIVTGGALIQFYPAQVFTGLPFLALFALVGSVVADHLEKSELYAALSNLKESTDGLIEQTALNYNNALMVNEVGQAISKQTEKDEVLENIVKALENRLGYDRGLILLADADKTRLSFRIGFGYSEEQLSVLKRTSFNLGNPASKGVFVTCFREQKPFLINDFAEISASHSNQSVMFAEQIGAHSFICCAIVCEGEALGILAVDNVRTKRALVASDMSLIMGVAPVIGMSIRNAIYMERERRMAEQMRQSQKMEAIGELAGGVAHDFNNLLTAIIGFTTLAQLNTEKEDPTFPYLEEVLVASERATHLTRGLLAFGRRQAVNPQPADLNGIVGKIEKLLRRLISEEIELQISLDQRRLTVLTDSGQIDQILLNLATNARDAMDNAGTLTIETGVEEVGPELIESLGIGAVGSYAKLVVRDTGKGMDQATRSHIFEPFFTTKEAGKGTGLGLAIVYGIVKQHGGFIDIRSLPGAGASFIIYLPLLEEGAVPAQRPQPREVSYAGTETILVVEDSPEVRKLTGEVLQRHGYRVIEAVDGQDGLEKFLAHQEEIKLVIMDVVMPKMNGKEAFAAIAKIKPSLKVLFTSGYTPDDVNRKGVLFDEDNFVPKPAAPQTLLRMVRELLSPAPG
ncbi:MAG: diguanylate cyclase [Geobacteraceae bacterium GWC2_58_44]|nr:MAG: diguanylate cyclase [Geobacteraceae bacterium GWC2_58_44]HBG04389.1 diguanylate cyclase [Geobacter sp.]